MLGPNTQKLTEIMLRSPLSAGTSAYFSASNGDDVQIDYSVREVCIRGAKTGGELRVPLENVSFYRLA